MHGEWLEICHSTNDLARERALSGATHGYFIAAGKQTAGRGRQGRVWISEEGNLFLSVILRPKTKKDWTWTPLVVAAAVVQAVRSLASESRSTAAIQLKWPNDIYINGKKCSGILLESSSQKGVSDFLVVGIGMNVYRIPENAALLQPSTALLAEGIHVESLPDLQQRLVENILTVWNRFEELGSLFVKQRYEEFSFFKAGQTIYWNEGNRTGTVIGLGEYGELWVQDDQGNRQPLYAEDVSVRA